ncbi:sucrase ferredoxin [Allokutzneria oryzae]|uniref:Sucrase ferredoxin n=1 Tax=Allokutzneria oryzae TaxID=1378989 RepID=A0ABV5ZRB1_9PSEU
MTDCAALAAALAEPLAGTAPVAPAWLCLEQPGPWGNDALADSHLDSGTGAELNRRMKGTGVRVVLIRRPGRHPDLHRPRPRRVYLASTRPGASWLARNTVDDAKQLLDLDFTALAHGDRQGFGTLTADPLLLVCTNGKRDRCCALLGRPIAAELAAQHGEAVWESTHTGGHRFAPAVVALPTGYVHGRLDGQQTRRLLTATAAGEILAEGCRGRATWTRAGQAAELAVRELTGDRDANSLAVQGDEALPSGEHMVTVAHNDGRLWRVRVVEEIQRPPRANSCGKAPTEPVSFRAIL